MKVELFCFTDFQRCQEVVNAFIADKKVIDIKLSTDPESEDENSVVNILVLYEEL